MSSEESTRTLAGRARAGDRVAFERLVERYRVELEALVSARLGAGLRRKVEIEDVIQETLVKAFQSIQTFEWRGEGSFLKWLDGIARHLILYWARRHARDASMPAHLDLPTGDDSPLTGLRRAERLDRLEDALRRLSPDHREVILLSRIQGLSTVEIGRRMHRSTKAVHQLLWRALQKLRSTFGETESFRLPHRPPAEGESAHG